MAELRTIGYEFGLYRLDPAGRSLTEGGQVIALPPKAVEVLTALVRQPSSVVTKQSLMESVWPDTFVEDANLKPDDLSAP